jgi:hypothetical protein
MAPCFLFSQFASLKANKANEESPGPIKEIKRKA